MTARLASGVSKAPRRFWINHGTTARPRRDDTVSTLDPGGNLEGFVSCGTSACAAARSVAARPSQRTSSRWTSHGPASVNAAQARSAPAVWAVVEPEAVDMTSRMPETWGISVAEVDGIVSQATRRSCRNNVMSAIFFTAAEVCVLSGFAAGLFRKRAVLRPAIARVHD